MPLRLPRAYPEDLPLAELTTAEALLVTAMRLWSLPLRDPTGHHPDWRTGFVAAAIDDAGIPAFEALFDLLQAASRRAYDVRCLRCPKLGDDEGLLLQLMSLIQHDRALLGSAILADWLEPSAARLALPPARALARALVDGRLVIPLRHSEAAALSIAGAMRGVDHGLALVQ